nr:immunoglobulin heavy chain junction region [Macaca mulatta]
CTRTPTEFCSDTSCSSDFDFW